MAQMPSSFVPDKPTTFMPDTFVPDTPVRTGERTRIQLDPTNLGEVPSMLPMKLDQTNLGGVPEVQTQEPDNRGMLGKVFDFALTPLAGREPEIEEWAAVNPETGIGTAGPRTLVESAKAAATTPLGIAAEAVGVGGIVRGLRQGGALRKLFSRGAQVAEEIPIPKPSTVARATEQAPEQIPLPIVETPVTRESSIASLQKAAKEAEALIPEQAGIYTRERAERIAQVKSVTTRGEAGFYQQKAKLGGEYTKVEMTPLRKSMNQEEIDQIVDAISDFDYPDEFVKINAKEAFTKMLNGQLPQEKQLDLLNAILDVSLKMPGEPKLANVPSRMRQMWELTRSLKSLDYPYITSAAFRQSSPLFGTRRWFQGFKEAAKSFHDERLYDDVMTRNAAHPVHQKRLMLDDKGDTIFSSVADYIGVASSDLKTLTSRDEQIRGILAEQFPVVGRYIRANNRAFTAFQNTVRTGTIEDWLKAGNAVDADWNITDLEDARRLANTLNELTGHGSLKIQQPIVGRFRKNPRELNLERAADGFSMVMYSPRLTMRDARMMNILNYMKNDKLVRMKYLEGAVRRAAAWGTFTLMADQFLGATTSWNPLSSDFGKARIGDTRADAGSGLLQWIVGGARQIAGGRVSSSDPREEFREFGSGPFAGSRLSAAAEFGLNRLHPSLAPIAGAGLASTGRPFYPASEALEAVSPFPLQDLYELMQSDPEIERLILGLASSSMSMGSMTYGRNTFGEPVYDIPGDIKFEGGSFTGNRRRGR
jgi:hypothetical protein